MSDAPTETPEPEAEADDPNIARMEELLNKQDSGGELSDDEIAFLDQMVQDPQYDLEMEPDES